MTASTYFEKAIANYKSAVIVFKIAFDDEEQLNIVGYHLQQALELAIKHILFTSGVSLPKTHDIDQLIVCAKDNDVDLFLSDELILKAPLISNWEVKTRYILGFKLEVQIVQGVLHEIEQYFEILYKKLKY